MRPVQELIYKLREIDPIGRQVTEVNYLLLKTDPIKNFTLDDGDSLYVPKRPNSINVSGEVLNPSTHTYNPDLDTLSYIEASGGFNLNADSESIVIIYPDGSTEQFKKNLFGNSSRLMPGTTLYVPRTTRAIDGISLAQVVTPILSDLAVTIAAIASISDN